MRIGSSVEAALGASPQLRRRWDELAEDQEAAFSKLDSDGDGVVTLSELQAAFGAASATPIIDAPTTHASYARRLDMSSPAPSLLSAMPPPLTAGASASPLGLRPAGSGYGALMEQRRTRSALEREMASYRLSSVKSSLQTSDQLTRDRARRQAMARKSESLISTISSSSSGLPTPRGPSASPRMTVAARSSAADTFAAERCARV